MALTVSMTGSGTLGEVAPGWSLSEAVSAVAIGDTTATTGTVSFSARSTDESLLVINNNITSTIGDVGQVAGVVQSVSETGMVTSVSHGTIADQVNLDVNVQPVAEGGPKAWCSALEYAIGVGPNPYNAPVSYLPDFAVEGASFGFFGSPISDNYVYPLSQFLNYANGYPATPTYDIGNGNLDSVQGVGDTISWQTALDLVATNTLPSWFAVKNIKANGVQQFFVVQFCVSPNSSTRISFGFRAFTASNGIRIIDLDGSLQRFGWLDGSDYVDYSTLDQTKPLMFTVVVGVTVLSNPIGSQINTQIAVTDHTNTSISEFLTNWAATFSFERLVLMPYHRLNSTNIKYFNFYTTTQSVTSNPAIIDYIEPADFSGTITPSLFDFTGYTGISFAPYPSTSGVGWELLQQLASAENFEVAVGEDKILIRDVGTQNLDITNRTTPTINPTSTLSGRQINIPYSRAEYVFGSIYDAQQDGNNIISVEAGGTTVTSVKFNTHPLYINQPELVDGTTWPLEPGQYCVMDDTGYFLNAGEWTDYGAFVSCAIDPDDPAAIQITVKGPYTPTTLAGSTYKLAVSQGQEEYAALNISGTGVFSGDSQLNLLTGVDPTKYTRATINTIDNPFVRTEEQAYDRGAWASLKASGPVVTMTTNVPVTSISSVGLTPGSLIDYNQSTYRVTNSQVANLNVGISAEHYVMVADMDAIWGSQTVAQHDALWGNYECQDQIILPYKVT